MSSPALRFQQITFDAFDKTRGMTDTQCQRAEKALVEAALEKLRFEQADDLKNEIASRPIRAFRYLVLDTFKALAANMEAAGVDPDDFDKALRAYLEGNPEPAAGYVTPEHLARYLDGAAH